MEHKFEPGSKVELLERGEWAGPYTVVDMPGRTYKHVALRGKYCDFEVYNDYPYNIRPFNEDGK